MLRILLSLILLATSLAAQYSPVDPVFFPKKGLVRGGLVGGWDLRTVNLLKYSEGFNMWAGQYGTMAHGLGDPSGGVTASSMADGTFSGVFVTVAGGLTNGLVVTMSVWARGEVGGEALMIGTDTGGGFGNIVRNVTSQWVRYTHTGTVGSATSLNCILYNQTNPGKIYIAFAQLNVGPAALPYVRTTDQQSIANMVVGGAALQVGSTAGVDTNDPTRGATGLVFDGVDDYAIDVGGTAGNFGTSNFTIVTVSVAANAVGHSTILGKKGQNWPDAGYVLRYDSGTAFGPAIASGSNVASIAASTSNSTWEPFSYMRRGSLVELYRGSSFTTSSAVIGVVGDTTSSTVLMVGNLVGWGPFPGTISFALFYNRALTPKEIRQNHRWLKAQMAQVGVTLP